MYDQPITVQPSRDLVAVDIVTPEHQVSESGLTIARSYTPNVIGRIQAAGANDYDLKEGDYVVINRSTWAAHLGGRRFLYAVDRLLGVLVNVVEPAEAMRII